MTPTTPSLSRDEPKKHDFVGVGDECGLCYRFREDSIHQPQPLGHAFRKSRIEKDACERVLEWSGAIAARRCMKPESAHGPKPVSKPCFGEGPIAQMVRESFAKPVSREEKKIGGLTREQIEAIFALDTGESRSMRWEPAQVKLLLDAAFGVSK